MLPGGALLRAHLTQFGDVLGGGEGEGGSAGGEADDAPGEAGDAGRWGWRGPGEGRRQRPLRAPRVGSGGGSAASGRGRACTGGFAQMPWHGRLLQWFSFFFFFFLRGVVVHRCLCTGGFARLCFLAPGESHRCIPAGGFAELCTGRVARL